MMCSRSARRLLAGLCLALLGITAAPATAAESRPWNLSLRGWGGFDSNVALVAEGDTTFDSSAGKSSSSVYGLLLAGDYRLYRQGRWHVAGTGSVTQTLNGDTTLNDFNLTSGNAGVAAQYKFRAAGRPAKLATNLGLRWDLLGGQSYGNGQVLSLDLSLRPTRSSDLGWFAAASRNNFTDDGAEPALSSRDGVLYRSGLRGMLAFNGNRQAISASASWQQNQAKGDNFDFRGPAASLQLTSYLVGPWAVALSGGYSQTEYFNYTVPPQRESKNYDGRLVFYGPLSRNLSADLSLGWSRSEAKPEAFQSERKNLTVGVTYAF